MYIENAYLIIVTNEKWKIWSTFFTRPGAKYMQEKREEGIRSNKQRFHRKLANEIAREVEKKRERKNTFTGT